MGLLSDPKARVKFAKLVARFNNVLCVLGYVIGLVWFMGLAHFQLNAKTYFSENALLPGLVEPDFGHGFGSSDFLSDLKSEVKRLKSESTDLGRTLIPLDWLHKRFRDIGLDVYAQNYTVKIPYLPANSKQVFDGQNVYAILRAPRASSTEALVISAPFRTESGREGTLGGIALMLGLASAFRRHTYWAKDIIFLITDNDEIGMQAWLSAYHHMPTDNIETGELFGRAGAIQAAINLEISQSSIGYMDIKVEGLNGQLPNLDLINTAARLCRRENILPSLHRRKDYWSSESWDGYQYALRTMLEMMWSQASGMSSANHGLFHRYNIEALTLHGVKTKNSRPTYGFPEMGRVVEGILRSLNNLLERFHQSFFFYLLPSTDRYASIGVYLIPFGVLCLPIVVKALALWIDFSLKKTTDAKVESGEVTINDTTEGDTTTKITEKEESTKPATTTKTVKEESTKAGASIKSAKGESTKSEMDAKSGKEGVKKPGAPTKAVKEEGMKPSAEAHSLNTLLSYLPSFLMAQFFGFCAYYGPHYFVLTSAAVKLDPQQGMSVGLLAVHVAVLFYPIIGMRQKKDVLTQWRPDVRVLRCMALLMLGIVLASMSVLNISLSFFIAVVWVPFVLHITPRVSRIGNFIQRVILLVISPLGVACMAAAVHRTFLHHFTAAELQQQAEQGLGDWLSAVWSDVGAGLYTLVLQAELFNNWTYALVTLVLLPNWVLFTEIVGCKPVGGV